MNDKRRSITEELKEARMRIAELEAEASRLREGAAGTAAVLTMVSEAVQRLRSNLEKALVPTEH